MIFQPSSARLSPIFTQGSPNVADRLLSVSCSLSPTGEMSTLLKPAPSPSGRKRLRCPIFLTSRFTAGSSSCLKSLAAVETSPIPASAAIHPAKFWGFWRFQTTTLLKCRIFPTQARWSCVMERSIFVSLRSRTFRWTLQRNSVTITDILVTFNDNILRKWESR